jgi:hypothetical protein
MNLNKVCIGRADSGTESLAFHKNYDMEYGTHWAQNNIGLDEFKKVIIDRALVQTKKIEWAIKHAIGEYWVERVNEDGHWLIYDIYVNLSDNNLIYWRLKYG